MLFRRMKSKKGIEMTMQTIVVIVICLVLIVIVLYLLMGKSKLFSAATSCEASLCDTGMPNDKCPDNHKRGFVACKEEDSAGKMWTGTCCVPLDQPEDV
jgi:hypothetical protein